MKISDKKSIRYDPNPIMVEWKIWHNTVHHKYGQDSITKSTRENPGI